MIPFIFECIVALKFDKRAAKTGRKMELPSDLPSWEITKKYTQ
jgi:hypothetical protein